MASACVAQARNRTRKNRHKLVTLDPPQEPAWDVVAAAHEGIRTCASLYLDAPPKGPETRTLLRQRDLLFGTKGAAALAEMAEIDARLTRIKEDVTAEFPLSAAEVAALREEWRERVLAIHDQERAAVRALRQER
jgi:hypothetical protein